MKFVRVYNDIEQQVELWREDKDGSRVFIFKLPYHEL